MISALLGVLSTTSSPARADSLQTTILVADAQVLANPMSTLMSARGLGVTTLRLDISWGAIAPSNLSWRRPRFNATDPTAYGNPTWGPYDAVIRAAKTLGIAIDLDFSPGAPRWATGPGQPRTKGYPRWQWEPNAAEFGQFVEATAKRYSGNWDPVTNRLAPGNPDDLPRVSFWSIWNEPNYGPSLAPQRLPGHPGVQYSPRMYRALVDDAWTALARTGHRTPQDTIIIGELAPRSELTAPEAFNQFNGMTPMVFLQNLYCLTSTYRPLRGMAAVLRGCPSTVGGSRRFVADNPALFRNSGVADHPYDEYFAPNQELDIPKLQGWALENTQDTSLATIGVLTRGLDRLTAAYGVHEQLPIWDTEYGYQTSPPHRYWSGDRRPWPNQATAAYYDNWAEYLHYKNPRIRSFSQYLLKDPLVPTRANNYGGFASGLINYNGTPKAGLQAFRMPLYLPRTTAPSPYRAIEVWGAARPAAFALAASGASTGGTGIGTAPGTGTSASGTLGTDSTTGTVTLLFKPEGSRTWSLLSTVALNAAGYYDAYERFPANGTLMAAWTAPADSLAGLSSMTLHSRQVRITVR